MSQPKQKNIFISYVHENIGIVEKMCLSLKEKGVHVWLDRESINPGSDWRDAIRNAIKDGDFYIACFSQEYSARKKTYMNEELVVAIEELRLRTKDQIWFIPVVLSGTVPDIRIGGGRSIRDLQWVELDEDNWELGIDKILHAINRIKPQRKYSIKLIKFERESNIIGKVDGLSSNDYPNYVILVYVLTNKWYIHPFAERWSGRGNAEIDENGNWKIETVWRGFQAYKLGILLVSKDIYPPPVIELIQDERPEVALLNALDCLSYKIMDAPKGI